MYGESESVGRSSRSDRVEGELRADSATGVIVLELCRAQHSVLSSCDTERIDDGERKRRRASRSREGLCDFGGYTRIDPDVTRLPKRRARIRAEGDELDLAQRKMRKQLQQFTRLARIGQHHDHVTLIYETKISVKRVGRIEKDGHDCQGT